MELFCYRLSLGNETFRNNPYGYSAYCLCRVGFPSCCTIKLNMFTDEFLNDGNCPSCQKCTEDSAYSDFIKSVKDCKGQNDCCCQTAEVKSGFDHFIMFPEELEYYPIRESCIRRSCFQRPVVSVICRSRSLTKRELRSGRFVRQKRLKLLQGL